MNNSELIVELKKLIDLKLDPLITSDYILLDLPYHKNIGDTLIWQGELNYLKLKPYRCLGYSNKDTFQFPNLSPDVLILLNGGGNFGDLYRSSQEFRCNVISRYQRNKILMFPQSVYYQDTNLIFKDSKILNNHSNLYLCARDYPSYQFMRQYFCKNHVLLVPDMAFYVDLKSDEDNLGEKSKNLYFKRADKESVSELVKRQELKDNDHVGDWPTFEKTYFRVFLLYLALAVYRRLPKWVFGRETMAKMIDIFAAYFVKDFLIKLGVGFIAPYSDIKVDRLHGLILSFLMGKNIAYQDNSTGKVSAFVSTWLRDAKEIKKL
ncbi:polysaccharide pyruvyl transferase YvfF [Sutterella sp. CAG:521]|nr:polysaccharide pyruvyl transferase YvfF [Sutterella sp. CAG:521]